jgi:hypothetical protein
MYVYKTVKKVPVLCGWLLDAKKNLTEVFLEKNVVKQPQETILLYIAECDGKDSS